MVTYNRSYKYESGTVTEGTPVTWECSPVPAVGEPILVELFGGSICADVDAVITLEWGSTTAGWTFLKSVASRSGEFRMDRDLTGDGDKRLRVTREVLTSGASARLDFWLQYGPRT